VAAYGLPRSVDIDGKTTTERLDDAFGASRQKVCGRRVANVGEQEPTTFSSFVLWCLIATPGQVLIRASALREVGHFDPLTVPSDDWDLWLRLSARGNFEYVRMFVINKRAHNDNVSSKGKIMAAAEPVIRLKLRQSTSLSSEKCAIARTGHRKSCLLKLSWANAEMRQCRPISAAKQAYRAVRSFFAYMDMWK
jgi:GT2 family glycosyltransferase